MTRFRQRRLTPIESILVLVPWMIAIVLLINQLAS